jgi:hypothetical protein
MSGTPIREQVQTKAEIQAALRESLGAVTAWIEAQPEAAFSQGPAGRWTMGQHLDHLVRSVKPINLGLSMPKFVIGFALGTSSRPSMPYAALAGKYEGVLDGGGKAGGRFVPPAIAASRRGPLLGLHRRATARLISLLDGWSEADLDRYAAPHPLLGKLTLRELLYFTIHHHDHHLQTLQRDYAR